MKDASMSEATEWSWAEHTVIDEDELRDYLFEAGSWDVQKLRIDSYCVKPNVDTLNIDGFIEFLRNQFHLFVFPEAERDEMAVPGIEALEEADYNPDPRKDGKLGELILFVLVDGLLDLPIVCHKMSLKEEPVQEVKGSDGLFFGHFKGYEAIALGEAKIYKRRSQGIDSALESTERFHGSGGRTKKRHELNVASRTLSEDLSEEETERIVEALSSEPTGERMIHPIFVGYETEWLHDLQVECTGPDELRDRITRTIQDSEIETKVREKIQSDYEELEKHWLLFFLLPLEDVDGFREDLQGAIYPYAQKHE